MATKKMNVLVYSGNGSTTESVRHCLYTLRRLLSPSYAVIPVSGDIIIKEPWFSKCALLVFPGGADLGYCRTLDGEGNRRISRYVNAGGSYLGFCAGGYFGSARCEFEVDDPKMAVVGDRELGFFTGICRGLAFEGFKYASEAGARAADIKIHKEVFDDVKEDVADTFKSYYNGGGVFVDAKKLEDRGVQILATYTEDLHVDSGEGQAAVVYRKVGEGHAVLTGPHPEFAPQNLRKIPSLPSYASVIDSITETDATRQAFMRLILRKLGLQVNEQEQTVPSLSHLHLTSHNLADVSDLVASWSEIVTIVDGDDYVKGENDVFRIEREGSAWGVKELKRAVSAVSIKLPTLAVATEKDGEQKERSEGEETDGKMKPKTKVDEIQECIEYTTAASSLSDQILDYDKMIKTIIPHEKELPSTKETPFHHEAFYANLRFYHTKLRNPAASFGKHLMYGEVVTSTSTLLEKNPSLLRNLPSGFTLAATTQVAARGRGGNVWIAPPGAMMFSTVLHHSFVLNQSAPVIFIQYLGALAVVQGIKGYAPGYDKIPVKLKWPNDIFAQLPGSSNNPVIKIGGVLVTSSYSGSTYDIVCGIGLNVSNALPTTSLNLLASSQSPPLKAFTPEKLLASILAHFEALYSTFCQTGFNRDMEGDYYDHWLHTNQIVTLETEGGMKARIKGITRDWGLLLAEELGWEDRPTGRLVTLQSDSNSFDFFRGLVRRKL
ncbi:class II aaRS and biotin synthetase [Cucurbitaria berberidis CBS 394.84]|uniref:Class II aaRS and biotin synthetase n=1 Tax=Cucurbitaria berberidis CBS 394.84 TaxID=1168544 RepID=A0A9P4GB62_9PLEO|nr:class II aaRS and biotin synthetase [Cucurbitaria berberidis CBS 394.84]KAF1842171.1 class II aaRS and biotin synthetase [Cucurbitaria berberidis CBS 394.84]